MKRKPATIRMWSFMMPTNPTASAFYPELCPLYIIWRLPRIISLLVNCGVKRHALLTTSTFRSKSYAIHFSPTAYPTSNYYYHKGSLPKILQPWHFIPKKGEKGILKGKPGSSSKHPSFQVAKFLSTFFPEGSKVPRPLTGGHYRPLC